MSDYVPGTEEKDPKKVIMALQLAASNIASAQDSIDTNTADIAAVESDVAANTADIATNTAAIASINTALANLIPAGTYMLFQQSSAPTGWTKQTTHNDKALRVVSGTASSGGTNAFSTVMAQTTVGSTTLTTAQIPAHTHSYTRTSVVSAAAISAGTTFDAYTVGTVDTGSAGGGGSHNHTITMSMAYVDIIIAAKN